jgi:predicted XRE-type DNA-binding protein
MIEEKIELVHGSGNVFRDTGHPNPEAMQLKVVLAARIVDVLERRELSVRAAQDLTGFAAADFSRVRNARLRQFTIERLMAMLAKLGEDIEITVGAPSRRAPRVPVRPVAAPRRRSAA